MENGKAGFGFRLSIAHYIRIRQSSGGDKLLLAQGLHRVQPVP